MLNDYMLDGQDPDRWRNFYCTICVHFNGREKGTCPAYPQGIPENFNLENKEKKVEHSRVLKGQIGTTIFEPMSFDEADFGKEKTLQH